MAEVATTPGTANVSTADRKKLAGLLKHYGKMARPFTACYRDQIKHGLSPDHAARRCAVLKDLIRGTTKWRKGGKGGKELALAELREVVDMADASGADCDSLRELRRVVEMAEKRIDMARFDPNQLRDFLGRWAKQGISIEPSSRGPRLLVNSPYDKEFISGVKALEGKWSKSAKVWSVPDSNGTQLDELLARTYAGQGDATPLGDLPSGVSLSEEGDRVVFKGPYSEGFRRAAKQVGRWDGQRKSWVFPAHRKQKVGELAREHYGAQASSPRPTQPSRSSGPERPASDRQRSYLRSLLNRMSAGELATASQGFYLTGREADDPKLTAAEASALIEEIR